MSGFTEQYQFNASPARDFFRRVAATTRDDATGSSGDHPSAPPSPAVPQADGEP